MKRIAAILISFLVWWAMVSFQNNEEIIAWDENRPLNWDDFKGKPEPRFAAATTSYDILKTIAKKNDNASEVKITAVFFKRSSWKKVQWINDDVLAHEQRHFDIVELFARKLRKKLGDQKFKSYTELEEKLLELYGVNDKEMDLYQDQYDEETDGSMNGDQQRAWQKKIAREIKELDTYKEPVILISY
jgi:hypothetical protein